MPVSSRRDFLRAAVATALAVVVAGSRAQELLDVSHVELIAREEHYQLIGSYRIQLAPGLEEALHKGVTLSFVQLFECDRPRDFWFAEDIAVVRRSRKLAYSALLKQYQLQLGVDSAQAFETLTDALLALGNLDGWRVLERRQLRRQKLYRARIRMYVDTSQLPKPLQLNAFASGRWDQDSGWREWSFRP